MKDSKKKNKILTIHNKNIFQSSSNKIAVCILAYQPDERLIQLYNDLSKSNYDFYVIVDDNKYHISSLEKKYTSFHFIQIKEEECIKNGYYGLNYYVKKGEPSAWEKAIFYFSTQKINTYPFVWFLEDDVFIPQKDVILEIDWQGAQQVRRLFPNAVSIFVLPPSIETLEQRLNSRGQDSQETISRRVAAARVEMSHVGEFDYVTINDQFDVALQDIRAIVRAQRLKGVVQLKRYAFLIQTLT
jgi:hypothetical protein